jgi:hypothetical protein
MGEWRALDRDVGRIAIGLVALQLGVSSTVALKERVVG